MAPPQQNPNLKKRKSLSRQRPHVAATSPNLDYIEMPDLADEPPEPVFAEDGSGKKTKPNFFHKYKKKSQFLNSNQENRAGLGAEFVRQREDLRSPKEVLSLYSEDEDDLLICQKISTLALNLKQKKYSKAAKSHGQLDSENFPKHDPVGNFEFQRGALVAARAKSQIPGARSGGSKRESECRPESNSNLSVNSCDEMVNRKCSEDIMFSKKQLSNNESLLSHSSGDQAQPKANATNSHVLSSCSDKLTSKKFRMEIEIEQRQELEKLLRKKGRAKGRTKRAVNTSRVKAPRTKKKNRLKFESFKNKTEGVRGKKRARDKLRKKGHVDLGELKLNRNSLNLKNKNLFFKIPKMNTKKGKKTKKPKDLTGLINRMSKASFKSAKNKFWQLKVNPYTRSGLKLCEGPLMSDKKPRMKDKKAKRRRKGQASRAGASRRPDFAKIVKMSKTQLNNSRKGFLHGKKPKTGHAKKTKKLNPNFKYVDKLPK